MPDMLTPGRWLGLKSTSTDDEIFTILAFDQRGSYQKMLPPDTPYEKAVYIKSEVVAALTPNTSAVLLDPEYGLDAAFHRARNSGLLMSLESSGYTGDSTYRRIEFYTEWNVAKIKQMGADAVKLLAYYHPGSGELAEEIEGVVADVIAECHRYDLPLFLEPVSYSLDKNVAKDSAAFAETRPAVVQETARRLGALKPDILKLEFPVDSLHNPDQAAWRAACEAISTVVDVPWVLLSAGVDYSVFEPQVQVACESGASGFLAGRAIWKECITMAAEEREEFLNTEAVERTWTLMDIAVAHARPWTAFYTPIPAEADWFKGYAAG